MSVDGTALRHAVGFFSSPADLLAQVVALVRTASGGGRPVLLGLAPTTDAAVRAAVDDVELVSIGHPDGPEGCSGQTLITARAREVRRMVSRHGPIVVITEHLTRFDGPLGRFWTELDAAANVALVDLPVTLVCFFPEVAEHPEVLDGALRNHALVLVGGELRHNPEHRCPYEVLAQTPVAAPLPLRAPDVQRTFRTPQLREIRALVEETMVGAAVAAGRIEDVLLAVNEVATNAVQHGPGEGRFRMWSEPGEHVFEVHDRGVLADPLPGLRPPHPTQRRHRGLWIARQLCDCLHVWSDDDGTHVRIHASV